MGYFTWNLKGTEYWCSGLILKRLRVDLLFIFLILSIQNISVWSADEGPLVSCCVKAKVKEIFWTNFRYSNFNFKKRCISCCCALFLSFKSSYIHNILPYQNGKRFERRKKSCAFNREKLKFTLDFCTVMEGRDLLFSLWNFKNPPQMPTISHPFISHSAWIFWMALHFPFIPSTAGKCHRANLMLVAGHILGTQYCVIAVGVSVWLCLAITSS